MTRQLTLAVGALLVVSASALYWFRSGATPTNGRAVVRPLVVSVRSAPQSFNWFTRHDASTYLVSLLTQAPLVRINKLTQEVEPWLAERWQRSPDGLSYSVTLRPDLVFSDGAPMTADDVVFSFGAAFEKDSLVSDLLTVGGARVTAKAIDPRTVDIVFPHPFGPGLRILDGLPILPKHKLQAAMRQTPFGQLWNSATPVADIAGLGPFVIAEYRPGERLTFERNPHYFRKSETGARLPKLERLVVQVIPDQDAQMLALQSGESDGTASEIRPSDYALVKRLAGSGDVQLFDLGPGMDPDGLWVNLKAGAFDGDSRMGWIQRDELRHAISLGVDRQMFADTVFAGAAVAVFGPVTPANRRWGIQSPRTAHADVTQARARLASIGLADRDGDGLLDDVGTRHARMTLLTQKGQTSLERGAAAIRDQMRTVGLTIDVVAMEAGALIQRFLSGAGYDAVYFNLTTTDTDPASQLDFWTGSGSAHVWNLGPNQHSMAWEREIDGLMAQQAATLDDQERTRLFAKVQEIFSAHLPMVHFVVPRVFVAMSSRVSGATPAVSRPQWLWAPDVVDVTR